MYHFVLISYSLDTQVMLIVILIDVQYSQKAVFSFEKGLNGQNPSFSGFPPPSKNPPEKFDSPLLSGIPPPLTAISKTLDVNYIALLNRCP